MHNELGSEKSLYLRQHMDNPVNWHPYRPETIAKAVRENKPLFISIGYSTCHWCHVMAHESFENELSAKVLNDNFIPIKVDREEFPAVDKMYQFYLHATGKRGGWPLSIFALPDGRPFFGGTYFPTEARHGLPAFKDIVTQLGKLYRETPAEAKKYADNYDKFQSKFITVEGSYEALSGMDTDSVLDVFKKLFDREFGGVGTDAKFPNIPVLSSLFSFFEDDEVAGLLKQTADRLCTSGIFDHVNGGFYRYTVDRQWHVPHFEKMLYDNALNALFLLSMFERTDNLLYLKIAEKTLDFILAEFSTPFGLIAAMDADSLNEDNMNSEGFYYMVSPEHIKPIEQYAELYEGVINVKTTDYKEYLTLEPHFEKLRKANERQKPAKDSKVILPLNMMFCSALLKMFEMSGKEYYMEQATALLGKLKHFLVNDRQVSRINYGGDIFEYATLEDYVFTIQTHLDFFEITSEKTFLKEAAVLTESALGLFYDGNVIFLDPEQKVVDTFDDSTPNPAGVLVRIMEEYAEAMGIPKEAGMLDFAADRFMKYTAGHPTLLTALRGYIR